MSEVHPPAVVKARSFAKLMDVAFWDSKCAAYFLCATRGRGPVHAGEGLPGSARRPFPDFAGAAPDDFMIYGCFGLNGGSHVVENEMLIAQDRWKWSARREH
jgi:hypothetical protein